MARPKLKIDSEQVQKLASLQCTLQEIAAFCDCGIDTIRRHFAKEIAKGKEHGKISIRRNLFRMMEKGNVTAAIWLSKQYLGMREPSNNDVNNDKVKAIAEAIEKIEII